MTLFAFYFILKSEKIIESQKFNFNSHIVILNKLEIVLGQLLHEALIRFCFGYILAQMLDAVAELDVLVADEVSEDEGGTSTLTHDGLNKDLTTAVESVIDESVGDAEVLLGVLPWLILNV